MKVFWQEARGHDHYPRKDRSHEESHERHHQRGDDELGDQPKEELQHNGQDEIQSNRQLRSDARRHEAEDKSTDRDSEPEARLGHAGCEGAAVTDIRHEDHDPAADGDLNSAVEEEKAGAYPGDAVGEGMACLPETSAALAWGVLMLLSVFGSSFLPECAGCIDQLDRCCPRLR